MANYATDSDLTYYVPDIFEHGVASFTSELTRATDTVNKRLKAEWWTRSQSNFDDAKLNDAQWTEVTVYAALCLHILPRLSSFRPDDVFIEMSKFYHGRYEDTFRREVLSGVDYDDNSDSVYSTSERVAGTLNRLSR